MGAVVVSKTGASSTTGGTFAPLYHWTLWRYTNAVIIIIIITPRQHKFRTRGPGGEVGCSRDTAQQLLALFADVLTEKQNSN